MHRHYPERAPGFEEEIGENRDGRFALDDALCGSELAQ